MTGVGCCLPNHPVEPTWPGVNDVAYKKKGMFVCINKLVNKHRHSVDYVVRDDKQALLIIAFHITVVCLCPLSGTTGW